VGKMVVGAWARLCEVEGKWGGEGRWVVEKDTAFQAASEKLLLRTRRQYYSKRQIENFHAQAL
jgi:hypothetical protein